MQMSNSEIKYYVTEQESVRSNGSKGNAIKWYKASVNNGLWLKADNLGYEGLSEVITSRVVLQTNILNYFKAVVYNPCRLYTDSGRQYVGCCSENYLPLNYEEVSLSKLVLRIFGMSFDEIKTRYKQDFYGVLLENISNFTRITYDILASYFSYMLQFDALVLNEDRHCKNIVFLRDTVSGCWYSGPIFDNGAALLSDLKLDYPYNKPLEVCMRTVSNKAKPFSRSFSKQLELVQNYSQVQVVLPTVLSVQISDLYSYYDEKYIKRACKVLEIQVKKYFRDTEIKFI